MARPQFASNKIDDRLRQQGHQIGILPPDLIAAIEAQVGFQVCDYHIEFLTHRAADRGQNCC